MELNGKDNFTIIIITHNREKYLNRALDYYSKHALNLIVCDSSREEFDFSKFSRDKWYYLHYPELSIPAKLYKALSMVKTKYVNICADDDFTVPNAIDECVNFLEKNEQYKCCTGFITTFIRVGEVPYFKVDGYKQLLEYDINEEKASDRICHLLNDYFPPFYAVHNTESLLKIYLLIRENADANFIEITQAVATVINGKMKALPIFYAVWEGMLNSGGQQYANLITLTNSRKYKKVYENWKNYMATYLIEHEHCSMEEARNNLEKGISLYANKVNGTITAKVKRTLKKSGLLRLINFKVKSMRLKNQVLDKYFYERGFPFNNEESLTQFNEIKECILSHKF